MFVAGLTLNFVYLYFKRAAVAWICMLVEMGAFHGGRRQQLDRCS